MKVSEVMIRGQTDKQTGEERSLELAEGLTIRGQAGMSEDTWPAVLQLGLISKCAAVTTGHRHNVQSLRVRTMEATGHAIFA